MFVDSHCHLDFQELREQLPDILSRMSAAQVETALCISTSMEGVSQLLSMVQAHPVLWASVGVHPDHEDVPHEPSVEDLVALSHESKVVAIGETGLDYFRLNGRTVADMQWQRNRFQVHIEAAARTGLPMVIHTRASAEDTLAMLRAAGPSLSAELPGVFHCFTESLDVAKQAIDLGYMISFSGILSFKNAVDLQKVAQWIPLDRVLIETDSPYLAPVPHRGKTNTPAWVPLVGEALARAKRLPIEDIAHATTDNFYRLFPRVIRSS